MSNQIADRYIIKGGTHDLGTLWQWMSIVHIQFDCMASALSVGRIFRICTKYETLYKQQSLVIILIEKTKNRHLRPRTYIFYTTDLA